MTISVDWYDEKRTILLQTFDTGWTWQDYVDLSSRQRKMMDTVSHRVDMIGDARGVQIPKNVLQNLSNIASNSALNNHENAGIYVIVGANNAVQTFLRIFKNVFSSQGERIFTASSLEEALTLIEKHRTETSKSPT